MKNFMMAFYGPEWLPIKNGNSKIRSRDEKLP